MDIQILNSLEDYLHQAAGYLKQVALPNGSFVYRINLNPEVEVKQKYNMLRHAGTLFALADYYHFSNDPEILPILSNGASFLQEVSIKPINDDESMLAVWTIPSICGRGVDFKAKLGGAGITLVALINIEHILPDTTPLETLKGLARFITYMQKEDGSFYSLYYPDIGPDPSWTSLYYPGEAALGMLMLYEIDPQPKWLDCATKALLFLAKSRIGKKIVEADHWALLATQKLFELEKKMNLSIPNRHLIFDHGIQVANSIILQRSPVEPETITSASMGTNLEGLLAAYEFLPEGHDLTNQIITFTERALSAVLACQVQDGPYKGAVIRASKEKSSNGLTGEALSKANKFNRRAKEVRIDYLQHPMSAIMQYLEIIQKQRTIN